MTANLPALPSPDLNRDIAVLARDAKRANGPLMALVNKLGGSMEQQLALLPPSLRVEVERVTAGALMAAHGLAGLGGEAGGRGTMAAVLATGAAGGAGGLVTSVAELPVTITIILRAIRAEAVKAGFDPDEPGTRAACLEVFAAGSPLAGDDGVNTSFLSARLTLTGPALQGLIAMVAPRLAAALGQKLAAQAVPVLGAVSGAAINAAFLRYYREVARIRFALMRLAVQHGAATVAARFAEATAAPRLTTNRAR
ncbi:MAG: staphylolytic protease PREPROENZYME LASA [Alphaproteobacteria bacterium]|nr:staphylolytic protease PREPROENZYME LASA [Alphaproteobacteria bacterium]